MTVSEMLAMPKGMRIEEYEKLLKDKRRTEKRIAKVSDAICDEEYSLEVLSDKVGSDRYNKHLLNKTKAEAQRQRAIEKLQEIEKLLQDK